MLARIDRRTVPVHGHRTRTIVTFAAGAHGKRERGKYHFWTAVGEDQYGPWSIVCRNRITLPYGERFERIKRESRTADTKEDREAYARAWKLIREADYIRPANLREVSRWAASHRKDWEHVTAIDCAGRTMRKLPRALL